MGYRALVRGLFSKELWRKVTGKGEVRSKSRRKARAIIRVKKKKKKISENRPIGNEKGK